MHGPRLKIDWQEDEETLHRLYREESVAEVRIRFHALWLVRKNYPVVQVAEVVGVNQRTVRKWISWYRQGGSNSIREHRYGGRQGQKPYLTKEQQEKLVEYAKEGNITTIGSALDWVRKEFGITYTIWGMRSLLERLKIKKKVPRPLADKASIKEQEAWKKGAWLPPLKKTG